MACPLVGRPGVNEDGVFHIFGEQGVFPHGYDGTRLAHFTSTTGLGDWDNHRVQDADIAYIPELGRFIMVCNMMDTDGNNPDKVAPFLKNNTTRVVGTFYSKATDEDFETLVEGMIGLPVADSLHGAVPDKECLSD